MQEVALTLIAKKLEVALLVEGDLPEGLAEYAAEDSSIMDYRWQRPLLRSVTIVVLRLHGQTFERRR